MKASWKNLHKFTCIFIAMLFALTLMLTTIFFMSNSQIFALEDASTAYLAGSAAGLSGDAAELYNKADDSFNGDVLYDIKSKLFNGQDPVKYIQANGTGELAATGSYVVKAPTINAAVGNTTNGMIIRLNGIDWMVVSMTLADIESKKDNVILTLYQADDYKNDSGVVQVSKFYSASRDTIGENMYASSILRRVITEGSNYTGGTGATATDNFPKYDLFRDKGVDSFAQNYLVQPKYITYQGKETITGRETGLTEGYIMPNDSYNVDATDKWHSKASEYKDPNFSFGGAYGAGNEQRYGAWQSDYIWIPSATETGFNDYYNSGKNSIWQLTDAQRAHTQNCSWLRSGFYYYRAGAYVVHKTGAYGSSYSVSNLNNGVRPALHFNLSAAYSAPRAKDPTDLKTPYNGENQTFEQIIAAATAAPDEVALPDWYDEKYTNEYLAVEHLETGKDVGEYWVKVSITETWNQAVRDELAKEDPPLTPEQIETLLPRFSASAGEAPSGEAETDTTRYFKIIITPKELSVSGPTYDQTNGVVNVSYADIDNELCGSDTAPKLGLHYTGANSYDEINIMPWKKGTYTATAILLNADNTAYSGNYAIGEHSCNFTLAAGKISILQFDKTSKDYTGSVVDFVLTGYSADAYANVQMTWGGVTLVGDDAKGYTLQVKNVGTYTIKATLTDKANFTWSDGKTDDKTYKIEVTKKKVSISLAFTPELGAGNSFQHGTSVTATATTSDFVSGEDVALNLTCDTLSGVGSLDLSTLAVGKHTIKAMLSGSQSGNYAIDGTSSWDVEALPQGISLSSVSWLYAQDGGTPVALPSGGVTYNGKAYTFTIDSSNLPVGVDTGNIRYSGNVQTYAATSAYTISVTLTATAGYAFYDGGTASSTKTFTTSAKINQAEIDLSKVVWSADELEYNAKSQSVTITEGIPSFLTIGYKNNTQTNVGTYKAEVMSLTINNSTEAKNWRVPTEAEIASNQNLKHPFAITPKKINVEWSTQETSVGATVIFVPVLGGNTLDAVEYTYWNEDKNKQMTLDEIFADYDQTKVKYYYVKVTLKASGGSYNATNSVLVDGESVVTEGWRQFSAGDSKTPVYVGLVNSIVTYNGGANPAEIRVDGGGLTTADITITYKDGSGSIVTGDPTNAGVYTIVVTLNKNVSPDLVLSGQREFTYTIEKATFDMSAVRWVDESGTQYTGVFEWAPNTTHNLQLSGFDSKLTVDYKGVREASDVGEYTLTAEFSVPNDNYVKPDDMTLNWEIVTCVVDLSEVAWDYAAPFTFAIVDGEAVTYSVALKGLPDWFGDLIIYDGVTKASNAGTYEAGYSLNSNNENYDNVQIVGSNFARLSWQIEALAVARPEKSQAQTFRDDGYTFEEISAFGSEFDWKSYFDVSVTNAAGDVAAGTGGSWTFMNVDTYVITIKFKQGMNKENGGTANNVVWTGDLTSNFVVTFQITKLVFDVNGWTLMSGTARPELQADNVDEIEKYFDYIIVKDGTTDELPGNAILENETKYTIMLRLQARYAGNVAVNYKGTEGEKTTPFAFTTDPLSTPDNFYRKPTGGELTPSYEYTGEQITFAFGDWFVADKMEVLDGDLFGTDCGVYTVIVGFKMGAMAAWEPQPAPGEKYDYAPVTITFTITKKQVEVPEESLSVQYTGGEQNFFPAGLDEMLEVVSGGVGTVVGEYTITLRLKSPDNTEWKDGNGGEERTLTWRITKRIYAQPTLPEGGLTYNGQERDIAKILIGFDANEMTISGDTKAKNAGDYTITITLTDTTNNAWAVGKSGVGVVADDNATISFPWSIAKAKIKPEWTTSDVPSLKMPAGFSSSNLGFNYTYYDTNGEAVSKSKLVDGEEYTVTATIKDEFAANFEFVDINGEVLETPTITTPYSFTPEKTGNTGNIGGDNTGGNNSGSFSGDMMMWMMIGMFGFMMFGIILVVVVLLATRSKSKEQPQIVCYPPTNSPYLTPEQLAQAGGVNNSPQLGGGVPLQLQNAQDLSGENIWNGRYGAEQIIPVNPQTMTPDDWTFMISEKDVANPDVLTQSGGDFVLYAVNKKDLTKFETTESEKVLASQAVADEVTKVLNKSIEKCVSPEVNAEIVTADTKAAPDSTDSSAVILDATQSDAAEDRADASDKTSKN